MKTTIETFLTDKVNAANLITTVESVMPHMPGNWSFLDTNSKLFFIYKNYKRIDGYISAAKPIFSDEDEKSFNWFNSTEKSETKIKRLNELQAASVAIRMYSFEAKEW
jgi:glyoxylate utilization-related uncharacterized protein